MKCKVLNRIIRGLHDLGNGLLLKLERGDLKIFFFLCPLVNTTILNKEESGIGHWYWNGNWFESGR